MLKRRETVMSEWNRRTHKPATALHAAWGTYLGRLGWEWFVTLTFDEKHRSINKRLADREAFWWVTQLGRLFRKPVGWLYAVEQGSSGRVHVHVLVVGVGVGVSWSTPRAMWRTSNGIAHIQPVDNGRRVVLYTTKQAYKGGDIVLSDTLARYLTQVRTHDMVDLCSELTKVGSEA